MPDVVNVIQTPEPTIFREKAEFVCTDARLNPDETVDGYVLLHLSNGRTLFIAPSGIADNADIDAMDGPPEVNWDELLQLLDAFRLGRRMSEVN